MPLNGGGTASKPAGTTAVPNSTISSAPFNSVIDDIYAIFNTARPIVYGGTNGSSAVEGIDNLSTKGTDIASATTTDIGAATGRFIHITGTTTITGLGTKTAGVVRFVVFDGALTLTHNATSLILPGGVSITTAAGDAAIFISEGGGNWRCIDYVRSAGQSALQGYFGGLNLAAAADAANDVTISAGTAAADTSPYGLITLGSSLTKQIDAAWAVGNNAGGLDTGSVSNSVYYIWLIQRSDTGVVDALYSLSSTAPTMPANYDRKRRIGVLSRLSATNSGAAKEDGKPSPWVSYTPVFNGIGTPANVKCRSRRVGSNLEVEASFVTGTVTATTFDMSLGVNGVNGGIVCDTFWNTFRPVLGIVASQVNGPIFVDVLGLGNSNVVNFGYSSSGRDAVTPVAGTVLGSTLPHLVRFSVPIEGWNVAP